MFELSDLLGGATERGANARMQRIEKKLDLLLAHLQLLPETPPWQVEVETLARDGQPIPAIKRLRQATGMSLRDAKAWVDDLVAGRTPPLLL